VLHIIFNSSLAGYLCEQETQPCKRIVGLHGSSALMEKWLLYMQMGSVIQREVQHAHLWQIGEDMKAGQLVKAAQHLQYLHEDFAPSEAECRFFVISWLGSHSQFCNGCSLA